MYFAFIDESGNPELNDKYNHFYVLPALIIQEKGFPYLHTNWKNLKQNVRSILVSNSDFEFDEEIELHLKDITNRNGNFKILEDNEELLTKILDLIYDFISRLYANILTIIIHKKSYYKEYDKDLKTWALKLLVERLNRFAISRYSHRGEYVLMVMDTVSLEEDEKRRKEIEYFMIHGTDWSEYPDQIIETPFIVDSNIHSGVQLVDAVAYLLRRYTRKSFGISPNAYFNQFVDKYMKKICHLFFKDSDHNHSNYIKFFPGSINVPDRFWSVF